MGPDRVNLINNKRKECNIMRWKIQTECVGGWGDLKDSETLEVCLYDTRKNASDECKLLGGRRQGFIVVREDVEETFNLY
ncbi:MAG: hypothetical protein EBR82_77460 [Caulobacteraceae bacterium]|nr:hypothetical protein [Caulobacteraceae bacterium]